MSAICAVYRWDGTPVSGVLCQKLLTAMREYGADASYWAPETPEAPVTDADVHGADRRVEWGGLDHRRSPSVHRCTAA